MMATYHSSLRTGEIYATLGFAPGITMTLTPAGNYLINEAGDYVAEIVWQGSKVSGDLDADVLLQAMRYRWLRRPGSAQSRIISRMRYLCDGELDAEIDRAMENKGVT